MKIVLICTGGLSTNWIVKRLEEFAKDHNEVVDLKAYGLADYYPAVAQADAVLLGPQISYYKDEIEQKLGHPIGVISANDYATANAEHIFAQAFELAGR